MLARGEGLWVGTTRYVLLSVKEREHLWSHTHICPLYRVALSQDDRTLCIIGNRALLREDKLEPVPASDLYRKGAPENSTGAWPQAREAKGRDAAAFQGAGMAPMMQPEDPRPCDVVQPCRSVSCINLWKVEAAAHLLTSSSHRNLSCGHFLSHNSKEKRFLSRPLSSQVLKPPRPCPLS